MPPAHTPAFPSDPTRVARDLARVGTVLAGKWRLDGLLALGGTSAVFAATHRNGLPGAVKVLDRAYTNDPRVRARFVREGTIANQVEHPGAVRVLDDDVAEDGCAFLVMEMLHGEALDERAARAGGRLGVQEVLWLAWHLLDVLAAAHAVGIVHRDVKPENVFLTRTGAVKVLDFGLACDSEECELERSLTRSGNLMGTPAFMSPEQARGRWALVDAQSDLWSVGATMFALLAGRFVHHEETEIADMMSAAFSKPAPSLAAVLPSAPEAVVQVVGCALERAKGKRYLDARSMQDAIVTAHHLVFGGPLPASHALASAPAAARPSNDAIFSFTSSTPRSSMPPRGEQPTLRPIPAPRGVAATAAPRRDRWRRALWAVAASSAAACLAGLAIAARGVGPAVQPAVAPTEVTVLSDVRMPSATSAAPPSSTEVPAVASSPETVGKPDARAKPVPTRHAAPAGGPKTPRYGPPPVTVFPFDAPTKAKPADRRR